MDKTDMPASSASGNKRRKSGPKTKTGCLTCKIRRVKCDETNKPGPCNRCTSTGRKCDGYPSESLVIALDASQAATIIHRMSNRTPGSTLEKRGFQYFITNTVTELAGYFHSAFWERLVLQACSAEPSLRHAVIAIGALHEDFATRRLKVLSSPQSPEEIATATFPMNQYSKAISQLRRSLGKGKTAPLTTLMSCILFVCFDSLCGQFDSAILHLRSGIKILQDIRSRAKSREEYDMIHSTVVPLLRRLSLQAVLYIDTRVAEERIKIATEFALIEEGITPWNGEINDLEEARNAMNTLLTGIYRLIYEWHADIPISQQQPETLALHAKYAQELSTFGDALNNFMTTHTATFTPLQVRAAALLKIHHTISTVILGVVPKFDDFRPLSISMNDPRNFEKYTPQFVMIVNLARSLVATAEQDLKNGTASFTYSTDLGVLGSLYYVCAKACSKAIREEAVSLLERCPRREGMWDSEVGSKMIREFWKIEEKHFQYEETVGNGKTTLREWVGLKLVDGEQWEWRVRQDRAMLYRESGLHAVVGTPGMEIVGELSLSDESGSGSGSQYGSGSEVIEDWGLEPPLL